jgi:hypothetical protein
MGPLGSGKSTACAIEILRRAKAQKRSHDGIRRTRWAIIRNSYPELKTTTLKTWSDWCPPQYGKLTMDSPITHRVQVAGLDIEVLFIALDREEDQKKLLSLELTGAWVNEAREIPKAIIDALTGRVGRYPSRTMGGCTWSGIVMDTNPPDDQSWWYTLAEEETPQGWEFFHQPSGLSPEAENIDNLPEGYYQRIRAGKDPDWVKVYVDGLYGFVTEGKAVYPMFRDRIHVAEEDFPPLPGVDVHVAADFGLTPALVMGQRLVTGQWRIFDEVTTENCGVVRFAEQCSNYMAAQYPEWKVQSGHGDPAGNQRAQTDERTALEIMKEYTRWKWNPAPTNDFTMRREVVVGALSRLIDGHPGILVSPKCRMLRKGFSGGYHYKFIKTGNGIQTHEVPNKNQFSHVHDGLQYLLLGGGEAAVVMGRQAKKKAAATGKPRVAKDLDYQLF